MNSMTHGQALHRLQLDTECSSLASTASYHCWAVLLCLSINMGNANKPQRPILALYHHIGWDLSSFCPQIYQRKLHREAHKHLCREPVLILQGWHWGRAKAWSTSRLLWAQLCGSICAAYPQNSSLQWSIFTQTQSWAYSGSFVCLKHDAEMLEWLFRGSSQGSAITQPTWQLCSAAHYLLLPITLGISSPTEVQSWLLQEQHIFDKCFTVELSNFCLLFTA